MFNYYISEDVERWLVEYECNNNKYKPIIIYIDILKKNKLGNCKYYNESDITPIRHCVITISQKFAKYPFLFKSILWHEFCHAEYFLLTGDSDHHEKGFHKRQWRKPILAIGDYIAKIVNGFI